MSAVKVSLTEHELEKIRNLWSVAWGHYGDKTLAKLDRALERSRDEKDGTK